MGIYRRQPRRVKRPDSGGHLQLSAANSASVIDDFINWFTWNSTCHQDSDHQPNTKTPVDGKEVSVLRVAQLRLSYCRITENLWNASGTHCTAHELKSARWNGSNYPPLEWRCQGTRQRLPEEEAPRSVRVPLLSISYLEEISKGIKSGYIHLHGMGVVDWMHFINRQHGPRTPWNMVQHGGVGSTYLIRTT